jgi:ribosomal protein S18 acetylase RimI-like enzyme
MLPKYKFTDLREAMSIRIRAATIEDSAQLAELITIFNHPEGDKVVSAEQCAGRLRACAKTETTIVAEQAGQLIGFGCLRLVPSMSSDEPYAELSELFVAEAFRREGVASAIMEHIERLAREAGAYEIVLLTGKSNPAQHFYRSLGYQDYALSLRKKLPKGLSIKSISLIRCL